MTQNPYEPSRLPAWESSPSSNAAPEPTVVTRSFAVSQFAVGLVAGLAIWIMTAPREAWDVNPYYSVHVLFAGAMSSLFRLRGSWWGMLGVYLGQVAGLSLLVPHDGIPIFPAWMGVFFCGTIQAVAGALLGGAAGYVNRRIRRASALRG